MNEHISVNLHATAPQRAALYLDHHATTPVDPRVADVAIRMMVEEFGNANGVENTHGERAASAVAQAKDGLARRCCADHPATDIGLWFSVS
ncbi:hypothetical protein [Neorhizobium galegae]|uniref:hypothetical protein n=1 Tax=Neorhizobium galegae TaxID=399 RepID=UPI00127F921F|nr:hypothetical protein [Neorhizobium galegae]KAA9382683.1 hypothetical protein F4V88_29340 [Neorhizobium galegae]MCM2501980.1 hypothetical protein [Neorhizobium galegae]